MVVKNDGKHWSFYSSTSRISNNLCVSAHMCTERLAEDIKPNTHAHLDKDRKYRMKRGREAASFMSNIITFKYMYENGYC